MKQVPYVKERLCPDKMTYVFLDEIQRADSFQKAVDSLFILTLDHRIPGDHDGMKAIPLPRWLLEKYENRENAL